LSRDLKKRVEDLEAVILPRVEEPPPPYRVMHDLIWAEWRRDWEPQGIERIEEAIADVIARLQACPLTAEYGEKLEDYKAVIVEVIRDEEKRSRVVPQDEGDEYREA
jgi:hypothetical protein